MRRFIARIARALAGCVIATLPSFAAAATTAPDSFLLTGARVLDARGERWLDGHAVLIVDGRIIAVAPADRLPPSPSAERVALDGLHLVPGLMDLHTHLLLRPYDEMSWDDQV